MSPQRPLGRVHIIGAGPVGLLLAALLQEVEGQQIRLYERRSEYTRTRMVSLAKYLIADSVESYKEDPVDGQDVEALFDPVELQTRLAYRSAVAPDLRALLDEWTRGFVQLNVVENRLTELIEGRNTGTVERVSTTLTGDEALELVEPGDVLVDCSGTRGLMRDLLLPGGGPRRTRAQHPAVPPRVLPRDHLPLRPALRVQRVLQVLQEHREHRLQVHPRRAPHLLRGRHHATSPAS